MSFQIESENVILNRLDQLPFFTSERLVLSQMHAVDESQKQGIIDNIMQRQQHSNSPSVTSTTATVPIATASINPPLDFATSEPTPQSPPHTHDYTDLVKTHEATQLRLERRIGELEGQAERNNSEKRKLTEECNSFKRKYNDGRKVNGVLAVQVRRLMDRIDKIEKDKAQGVVSSDGGGEPKKKKSAFGSGLFTTKHTATPPTTTTTTRQKSPPI